jgi:hypothetical protein
MPKNEFLKKKPNNVQLGSRNALAISVLRAVIEGEVGSTQQTGYNRR